MTAAARITQADATPLPAGSILDGLAQSAGITVPAASAVCPECLAPFRRRHPRQLFCSPAHQKAWNKRMAVRGAALCAFAMTGHITRNGTRGEPEARDAGRHAKSVAHTLIQRWRDEDRRAGRMAMPAYMARRIALGYAETDYR